MIILTMMNLIFRYITSLKNLFRENSSNDLTMACRASVIGPAHISENKPNQDSSGYWEYKEHLLAATSDGLGSHSYSNIGSNKACNAYYKGAKLWIDSNSNDITDLFRLIQSLWLMDIKPYSAKECGATLSFTIIFPDKRAIIAQLGDGAIYHYNGKQIVNIMTDEKSGFGNETDALKEKGVLAKWKWKDIVLSDQENLFLLMTDGVSEDINPDMRDEFAGIVFEKIKTLSSKQCSAWLDQEFKDWKTPNHTDDKTICAVYKKSIKKI